MVLSDNQLAQQRLLHVTRYQHTECLRGIARREGRERGPVARLAEDEATNSAMGQTSDAPPAPCGQHTVASAASRVRARRVRAFRRPVPEARPEAVRHGVDLQLPREPGQGRLVQHAPGRRRKHDAVRAGGLGGLVEDFKSTVRQRHSLLVARLHARAGNGPDGALAVD